jgi:hypothetical protein
MDYLKYLFYFVEDSDANKELAQKYPEIELDLVSSKENPNCSCRGRVWDYFVNKFTEEKEKTDKFFENLYLNHSIIKLRIESLENDIKFIRTIHIIDDDQNSWNEFQDKLNGINYKTISFVKDVNKLKIFFT